MNTKTEALKEHNSSLPFKTENQPTYKIIGMVVLILVIALGNYFFFSSDKKTESKKENDTYEASTLSPVSSVSAQAEAKANTPSATLTPALANDLQAEIAKAKAKDFIERLQASQGGGGDGQQLNSYGGGGSTERVAEHYERKSEIRGALRDPNTAFLVERSNSKTEHVFATHYGALPYIIGQGKFIFANLSVAINSDLPGQVTAVVSQDVYGDQGRKVLIPKGSILIGEYKSGLVNNQSRLFVVWTRVREPNGIDVMIGSEGTDYLGRAGLTGAVDYHFLARFGASSLIALIGAGASTMGVNPRDEYNSMASYRQELTEAFSQQSKSMLSQSISIPPTIHVAQGENIVVFVNRDLDFSRVYR